MKTLGIVAAKATNRGLPGKNSRKLGGKPLWRIAMDQAVAVPCDYVVVTTDIPAVWETTLPECVSPHRQRPADDTSTIEDTCAKVLAEYTGYDAFVVLNPTHPFRSMRDIRECVNGLERLPRALTVKADYCYTVPEGQRLKTLNRQDRDPRYVVSGSVYAALVDEFLKTMKLVAEPCHTVLVPAERAMDIDTYMDFQIADNFWEKRHVL